MISEGERGDFCMAHLQKFTRGATGHMFAHFDRKAGEKIGNENVDLSRSHLNYNLASQPMSQLDFLKKRLGEVKVQNRKDVNIFCDWIVTAPKNLPESEQELFFQTVYDFCSKRYGEKNVVSAYVHMDEVTPHIHFAFIPVVFDRNKEKEKVSAKETINRRDLQTFHSELSNHLESILGHEVDILNEATKNGNKTVAELKKNSLNKEIILLEETKNELEFEVDELSSPERKKLKKYEKYFKRNPKAQRDFERFEENEYGYEK